MFFEGREVEIIVLDGQPYFNPYHVGDCLDISDVTVRRHLQGFNNKQVVKLTNSDVQNMNIRKLNNAGENFLTVSGVFKLIFKSSKDDAEKFQDWVTDDVLPSIASTGGYQLDDAPVCTIPFKEQVECVGIISDMLRVNDAGKLTMLNALYKDYNVPTNFLPKYELNGSRETKSATELLKRFGLGMSAKAFNTLLMESKYLEERSRPSTKQPDKVKRYKALTEKGLEYGENAISPQNHREVQPLYYADSFIKLYEIVTGIKIAV